MDAQTIVNAVASALRFAEYVPGTGPQVDAKLENAANFIVRPEVVAAIEAGLTAAEMAAALAHGLPAKASPDQAKAFQARLAGG